MNFKIADGSTKNIIVGSQVKLIPDRCPTPCIGMTLPVTKIDQGYPFVHFYKEEIYYEDDEQKTNVLIDEESAVSPELISEVT